jgi:hypothetical protein
MMKRLGFIKFVSYDIPQEQKHNCQEHSASTSKWLELKCFPASVQDTISIRVPRHEKLAVVKRLYNQPRCKIPEIYGCLVSCPAL